MDKRDGDKSRRRVVVRPSVRYVYQAVLSIYDFPLRFIVDRELNVARGICRYLSSGYVERSGRVVHGRAYYTISVGDCISGIMM